jgi:hypothetical protein
MAAVGWWSVAYTPDWEPLADALKRVMATGVSEDQAKTDLCWAVADRKIAVRVRIAGSDRIFSGDNVDVPRHLRPGDLDWVRSRPFAQWPIGPRPGQHYFWDWNKQSLDLIELSTRDVMDFLCKGSKARDRPQRPRGKSSPAMERAQAAIQAVHPTGVPDQATESNKILCGKVSERLKESKLPSVSDDTILRAAGRRK